MIYKNIHFNLGFICSTYRFSLSTNHSLKLKNLNKINILKIIEKNIEDFINLLKLSQDLGYKIFRLGSNFIPFASHPKFQKSWFKEISFLIKNYLPEIKKFEIRITMHPGQYVVLSSDNKKILERSLKELEYHFWLLESMEMNEESIVVIHVGGAYGNKNDSVKRFINNINKNKWLKKRLAVENDERIYNSYDILKLCYDLEIPFVFDYFHHKINYAPIKISDILSTWKDRIPEFHLSSKGEKKFVHGDFILKKDFIDFLNLISQDKYNSFKKIDIILEAKKKELAVIKLLKNLKKDCLFQFSKNL